MIEPMPGKQRLFSWVAWATVVFNLAVIAGGTIVRATGSGDGCGETWPKCGDQFVPPNATVETLIEFSHRVSSFMAGLGVAAVFFLALWVFKKGHIVRRIAFIAAVLLIVEALLGAALVLYGWVDDDTSIGRMFAVALHLTNTFLLLGALSLTAWWGSGHAAPDFAANREKLRWLIIGASTILLLGATGALNAIGDAVFPPDVVSSGLVEKFGPGAPLLLQLRVIHPAIAVVGGIFVAWIAMRLSNEASDRTKRLSFAVTLIVFSQMFIGVANIFLLTPLFMQVTHLMIADALWIVFVLFGATVMEQDHARLERAEATG
jgi:heme A synthase